MEQNMTEQEVKRIETAAQNQEADAQFELGQLYEYGTGVEQDYQKAMLVRRKDWKLSRSFVRPSIYLNL